MRCAGRCNDQGKPLYPEMGVETDDDDDDDDDDEGNPQGRLPISNLKELKRTCRKGEERKINFNRTVNKKTMAITGLTGVLDHSGPFPVEKGATGQDAANGWLLFKSLAMTKCNATTHTTARALPFHCCECPVVSLIC